MKKLNINYRYFIIFALTLLIGIASYLSVETEWLVNSSRANQAVETSTLDLASARKDSIAFSPDGNTLAIASPDGNILIWDIALGQIQKILPRQFASSVNGIIFGPDSKSLASLNNNSIRIWDTVSGNILLSRPLSNQVDDLTFSPNGKTLAFVDQDGLITFWDLQSGSTSELFNDQQNSIETVAFSPDSRFFAILTEESQIKLLDMTTEQEQLLELGEIVAPVTGFKFSPNVNANTLVVTDQSDRITFIDIQSDTLTQIVTGHQSGINAFAFNREGTVLATGDQEGSIKLWDMASSKELLSISEGGNGSVSDLVFSPDGNTVAIIGESQSVYLWDILKKSSQYLLGHSDWVEKVVFNTDPNILTSMDKSGEIIVWDLRTGMKLQVSHVSSFGAGAVQKVQVPKQLNTDLSSIAATGSDSGKINVQSINDTVAKTNAFKAKKKSNHDWKGIVALAIRPDGMQISGASQDGSVQLWNVNGKLAFSVTDHHGSSVTAVTFSADGKNLFTTGRDTEVQKRDVIAGKKSQTLFAHEHPIRTIAASSDGKYLVSAGEETRIMLWDAASGKLIRILSEHKDFVNAVAFSSDGETLASADAEGRILLWNVKTGKLLRTLLGHSGEVNAVAFSANGNLLASGSADSQVKLWDVATGQQIQNFAGHQSAVRSVAFNPDDGSLVSAGEDTKLLVWNISTHKLEKQISVMTSAVNALKFSPVGNLFIGSEDGDITEFDAKQNKIIKKFKKSNNLANISQKSTFIAPLNRHFIDIPTEISGAESAKSKLGYALNKLLDWIIPSAEAASDLNQGPGGPILVIVDDADKFGYYYAEILRTEGLNYFTVADISTVSAGTLTAFDVAILAKMTLSASQVAMFTDWVTAGGNLIAMRPDQQLSSLLGISPIGSTLSNGYLLVNQSQAPGSGIVNDTIQFHGVADRYSISGASNIATLYTNASTATSNPAVTLRSVGSSGGQAAAFTYDLASSIVYTRQGNPAWATQERDGFSPIRSDDKFFGAASGDPQPDWVDLNKVAIPQADEQQRLLANLILHMNGDKKPLPRFWYFPKNKKAVVVMTGDDHGNNGTQGRFDQFIANSPPGCSVTNWECIRGTSYIYPNTPLTDAQAASYTSQGFEVGLHVNTNCADFTPVSLRDFYSQQIGSFTAKYSSIPAPITQRHHCIAWSDWVTGAIVQLENGLRFDTSYYFWPPGWVQDSPGFFNGSGMPMRFANLSGSMTDVYHAATQMTDESGQTYPFTINTLLDRALGSPSYYGAFTVNAHTDSATSTVSDAVVNSALSRGVPIVSSNQMLTWLDGRNSSSFDSLNWTGNTLSFNVTAGSGANNLRAMLPANSAAGVLLSITYTPPGGSPSPVSFTVDAVKGIAYGFFPALSGAYSASFGADTTPPTVTAKSPTAGATGAPVGTAVTVTFSEAMDAATISGSTFELRDPANNVIPATVSYNANTFTATLTPATSLTGLTTYSATVKGGAIDPRVKDLAGNAQAVNETWSFTTGDVPCSSAPCSAWSSSTVPGNPAVNDPNAVELGVKFRADNDGYITGIRFYKGSTNTGTHIGSLWAINGSRLATATFSNETASGWQQVNFSTPVAITANTVYVASYFTSSGNYAADSNYFTSTGVNNGPIHLLQDGVSGGNGVYAYGASSSFPTNTFQSSNYWVDVVYSTSIGPDTTPPTVTDQSPPPSASGVATNTTVTVTFSEAMDATTITTATFELRDSANALVTATVSYNGANRTATLTPGAALAAGAAYTATVKGGTTDPRVKDSSGNALAANFTWSFTTAQAGGGSPNCSSGTNSIWASNTTPTVITDSDTSSVELGVKFRSNISGFVCGIRFYKGSTNTGTHIGKLWNSVNGQLLASATFQNETASGWQQVSFASPIAITANVTYVASYLAPVGRYSADSNYFTSGVTSSPLYAFSSTESGGNGVYLYGAGGFPTNSFQASNYWVDVVFTSTTGPDTTPPTVLSTSPANGATNVPPASAVTVTFSEGMNATTVTTATFELRGPPPSNSLVPASVTYNAAVNTATLTPTASLAANTPYTAKIIGGASGVKDSAGNALAADFSWGFTTGADLCSLGGNPIGCENSKTGNPSSEWDITGAGDSTIQGYATDISVNRGQTVQFKVNTPSTNYRLDIYRLGYYNGNGARKVATVEPSATLPQSQPACLNHTATGLIDCGNWAVSASWAVPSSAVSGIYFAKLVREDGITGTSHIVFIVRDDASTSDLLFQTSDTTWQAYNDYGGNSLYTGSPAGRAYKVSYNRPFNTRSVDNGQDWLFNSEYPMVRWLEANGYDVSYTTGIDSDRRGNLITNHKTFLSVGHDEYWSKGQRTNVETARDSGVHLAFFSGNEVFWKTRWENNITNSSGTLGSDTNRTLVCYKETHANAKIDPSSEWTGTWRDPRFSPPADGGRPENGLTGTIFTVNDGATTSIQVPAADGDMRFWRNTSVASLTSGSATLPNGTLGYEWDEDLDNGFRPGRLIRLSRTVVNNAPVLQDYGSTYASGTATHSLTLYKVSSGALVFGAGTVQWPWGLDSNHDRGGTSTDVSMQQATVNLFADMGVQPSTLQSGLSPATPSNDTASPASAITFPSGGSSVTQASNVTISGTATDVGGQVGGIEVSVDGGLSWHPANGRTSWTYNWTTPGISTTVNIKSRAVDDSLNLETPGAGNTVCVGSCPVPDTTPPTVSMTAPANGATVSGTTVTVSATANDNVGVTSVQFLLDGAPLGAPDIISPYNITWDSTQTTNGLHTLSAVASDAANNSANAANISVTVSNVGPEAPTTLTGTAVSSTQINLSWADISSNEDGFRIERCQNAGCSDFTLLATVGSNISSFTDTGLTSSTSYSYRVQAFNGIGNSSYSNTATVLTSSVTGFLNPAANGAVTSSAGDNNGFQTSPTNAYTNDGSFAVDTNSGSNTNTSCTNTGKDKHLYFNYGVTLPVGAVVKGIEVRLDARADATGGNPRICIQLSSDGGSTWTTAQTTPTLTTAEATYLLGGAADLWGRSWTVSNFSNTSFRVRVINVASNTNRDFSLDWVAVQVTYQ